MDAGVDLVGLGFSPSDEDLRERGRYAFDFYLFWLLIPFEVFSGGLDLSLSTFSVFDLNEYSSCCMWMVSGSVK